LVVHLAAARQLAVFLLLSQRLPRVLINGRLLQDAGLDQHVLAVLKRLEPPE
jgi:hypothetical protein